MGELTGILLAAGKGERFGGDKGLAQLPDGLPMALRSALNLRAALADVVCVVRPDDRMLHDLLCEHGFKVVVAQEAEQGMSASLQAGISATPEAAGWMVALADMPLIRLDTYQRLVVEFFAEQKIIVPCLGSNMPSLHPRFHERLERNGAFKNREIKEQKHRLPLALCRELGGEGREATPGHPVTFPARCKPDLLSLRGDKGAQSILQQHADAVQRVIVDDPGILQDFDTRQALKRLFI